MLSGIGKGMDMGWDRCHRAANVSLARCEVFD